jgi:hypothetical protein
MTPFCLIVLGSCTIAVLICLLLNRLEKGTSSMPEESLAGTTLFVLCKLDESKKSATTTHAGDASCPHNCEIAELRVQAQHLIEQIRFSEITLAGAEHALASLERHAHKETKE